MRLFLAALCLFLTAFPSAAQPVDEFVVLVSGDTLRGEVEINEPFLRSAYVSIDDSVQYRFDEVLEVKDGVDYYAIGHGGVFAGTMLAKRTSSGSISLYERVYDHGPGMWMPGPNGTQQFVGGGSARYDFFRKEGGPVQRYRPALCARPCRTARLPSPC